MEQANEILQEVYDRAGAGEQYQGRFFPGPHLFDLEMQSVAFDRFDRWLRK